MIDARELLYGTYVHLQCADAVDRTSSSRCRLSRDAMETMTPAAAAAAMSSSHDARTNARRRVFVTMSSAFIDAVLCDILVD